MRYFDKKAFTLPEMLLTALILSYSLSVILATYTNSLTLNDASRNLTIAVSHAQFVVELIRNTAFANIATNISGGTWNWDTAAVTAQGLNALKNESIATSSSSVNPLSVTVTVSWNNLHGRGSSKALTTYISG